MKDLIVPPWRLDYGLRGIRTKAEVRRRTLTSSLPQRPTKSRAHFLLGTLVRLRARSQEMCDVGRESWAEYLLENRREGGAFISRAGLSPIVQTDNAESHPDYPLCVSCGKPPRRFASPALL